MVRKTLSPADAALVRVRAICFAFPGTTEKLSHGTPSFFVRGKMFAMFADDHHGDDRIALWCKSSKPEQQRRVAEAPARFFVPPYVGVSGWVGVRIDSAATDWDEVAIVAEEAWVAAAPPSALRDPIRPPPRAVLLAKTDPAVAESALARLMEICAALPDSSCERSKRNATFRVGKKPYAYFLDNYARDGIIAATWKATLDEQAALIARDPKRYLSPPYIGPRGWVAQRVDLGPVDWADLSRRIAASHALAAPKRGGGSTALTSSKKTASRKAASKKTASKRTA